MCVTLVMLISVFLLLFSDTLLCFEESPNKGVN